jgi:hypothetical protein
MRLTSFTDFGLRALMRLAGEVAPGGHRLFRRPVAGGDRRPVGVAGGEEIAVAAAARAVAEGTQESGSHRAEPTVTGNRSAKQPAVTLR